MTLLLGIRNHVNIFFYNMLTALIRELFMIFNFTIDSLLKSQAQLLKICNGYFVSVSKVVSMCSGHVTAHGTNYSS